ncbi:hypothetical protein WMY93_033761 [Mugilogobius chulae]|uniref:ubiquitinyl hydrolase 1 n=1 Tax=Mugilogobius chulae TaxID=88201 RepID=A0AAW0MST0_9GOBI
MVSDGKRPRVFTELIKGFGCKGAQVEEIWSMEPENFENLKPVHGLIFLFKWQAGEEPAGSIVQDSRLDSIFLQNSDKQRVCHPGHRQCPAELFSSRHRARRPLSEFREFSQSFDAAMKGLALSNSEVIRQVHNSFARQQMFEFDAKSSSKDEDAFHFVSYVPVNGRLYELDGLREGPIDLGVCNQDDWISAVHPVIEKRIQKYSEGEIRFNLMAIVSDRKMIYERKITELQTQLTEVRTQLTEVRTQLTEVRTQLTEYERSSQSTNATHREVRTQLTEVRTQLTEVRTQLTEVRTQLTEVRTQLTEVRTQVTEVRTQVTEVRTQLTEVRTQVTEVRTQLTEVRTQLTEVRTQLTEDEPMDTDQSSSFVSSEIAKYQLLIETENQKLQRYKIENIRRKHNYLPFIMELLKTLAEYQQLMPLVEKELLMSPGPQYLCQGSRAASLGERETKCQKSSRGQMKRPRPLFPPHAVFSLQSRFTLTL